MMCPRSGADGMPSLELSTYDTDRLVALFSSSRELRAKNNVAKECVDLRNGSLVKKRNRSATMRALRAVLPLCSGTATAAAAAYPAA